MTKPICIVQAPLATRSGYGDMSRDIIRHIASLDQYDLKLISTPWGACPTNALSAGNPKDKVLIDHLVPVPVQLPRQPELFVQISVPNEFQPVGKYNIGITAGIETTACSPQWIDGMNRMDLILTISEHSKKILQETSFEERDQSGIVRRVIKLEKPIEVLHNCVDTRIFHRIADPKQLLPTVKQELDAIEEDFCFLFVGHWLKGDIGEDRKNVGLLVNIFCETFKHTIRNRPALVLKTSGATLSVLDREEILGKIRQIRAMTPNAPNVYLIHGDLTEPEMNSLYNHPKIQAHISLTKGEGFGRPLLEASQSYKPILASGWSGHLDFLNPQDVVLLNGELRKVEAGAVWENVILADSEWFNVDPKIAGQAMLYVYKNYGKFLDGAYRLASKNKKAFSFEAIEKRTHELFEQYVPKFAMPVPIQLPKLKKVPVHAG